MVIVFENYHEAALGRYTDTFVVDHVNEKIYVYDAQGQYALIDATGLEAALPQTLSIVGNLLQISNGNFVMLPEAPDPLPNDRYTSPDGTIWQLSVDNDGSLHTTNLGVPDPDPVNNAYGANYGTAVYA